MQKLDTEYSERWTRMFWIKLLEKNVEEQLDIQKHKLLKKKKNELRKITSDWKAAYSNKYIALIGEWLNLSTWMCCQAMTEEDWIEEEWELAMLDILQDAVNQKKYTALPWL